VSRLAFLAALVLVAAPAHGQTIVVSPDGPVRSLAEAVRLAPAGGRIVVRAGTYQEGPVVVDRRVEITGEGRPVIRGRGDHTIILVTADSVVIRGLVLEHVAPSYTEDRAAIRFNHVDHCLLEDSEIRDSFFGVYVAQSKGCRLLRNVVAGVRGREGGTANAIHLWNSREMEVIGNRVSGHRDGLYFEFVKATRIEDNDVTGNVRYGLHFMFSDSCAYRRNRFHQNGAGVAVMYTRHVTVEENRFEDNWGTSSYGLLLKEIGDSRFADNLFRGNTVGLYVEGGGRTVFRGNRFLDNGWAVKLMANSIENRFEGNAFAGNSFDIATNSRSSESDFAGNWWDRYDGFDLDRDGRGDVPFRPVRLFSLLIAENPPAMMLLRSLFVDLLDAAERVLPILTPETLVDASPLMERPR
jgi:nitrous oxidase accessory protein